MDSMMRDGPMNIVLDKHFKNVTSWINDNESKKILKDYLRVVNRYLKYIENSDGIDFNKFLSHIDHFTACEVFSNSQMVSKQWLVQKLSEVNINNLGVTYVVGGWCGLLSHMFYYDENILFDRILSIDIDPKACLYCDILNNSARINNWKIKSVKMDMFNLSYDKDVMYIDDKEKQNIEFHCSPDTIVNTSCEHIDFKKWINSIPNGKKVILQSNNMYEYSTHINCYKSLKNFERDANLKTLDFSGEIDIGPYKRFMLIGSV